MIILNSANTKELVFDDVLIDTAFSTIKSRKDVSVSQTIYSPNLGGVNLTLSLPIVSSNMECITGARMARKITELGGLAILHRFISIKENIDMWVEAAKDNPYKANLGASIGISENELDRAMGLYDVGCRLFCIDVAHGAQQTVAEQFIKLKLALDDIFVIVGNFSNQKSISNLENFILSVINEVPDMYKIGVGSGSICATRLKTGVGRPLFSTTLDCCKPFFKAKKGKFLVKHNNNYNIIADGGFKKPADICKALAAGAKCVMLGSMLSGTDEAEGTHIVGENITTSYWGSASGGYASGHKTSEGVVAKNVPYKGKVETILKDIEGGLRSSMTYTNSMNLDEYRKNAKFIVVSNNTVYENNTVESA